MGSAAGDTTLDSSSYSAPVRWVGLYIASASILCSLAMAADTIYGLRRRQLWFPSRLFSLNATTLTILSIATKLPVDLSSPMPTRADQLSKLSGTALLTAAVGNLLPSLGDAPEPAPNVVALAILVLTVAVNVYIQMGTGVIHSFLVVEHAAVLLLMLVLLLIVFSSALAVTTTKQLLEEQYDAKHTQASGISGSAGLESLSVKAVRDCVERCWMMAHTCSSQFVLSRSATCTASGAFCLLNAGILTEAVVRSMAQKSDRAFPDGASDYTWSTTVVLFSQAVAVAVGTIAPAYRWFSAVSFWSPPAGEWSCRDELMVEDYWVCKLVEWRDAPLPFDLPSMRIRRSAHKCKRLLLSGLIGLQSGIVLACKLVRLASVLPVTWLNHCKSVLMSGAAETSSSSSGNVDSRAALAPELSFFVMHLEGEKDLIRLMTSSGHRDINRWIRKGTRKQPSHLIHLIEKHSTVSYGFREVGGFDTPQQHNCWALPLVTLGSIALALPGIERGSMKALLRGINQGLRYVRLVEKHLDARGLVSMRDAADMVWMGVDLSDRWLDEDFHRLPNQQEKNGCREIIQRLGDVAKECIDKFRDDQQTSENPYRWPANVLASVCMYDISRTILHGCDDRPTTESELFLRLQTIISDILGACMTNLPRVIYMECICSAMEVREKSVREAAFLLGETEKILEMIGKEELLCLYPEGREYIDNWRKRVGNQLVTLPSTSSDKFSTFTSDDLSLCME